MCACTRAGVKDVGEALDVAVLKSFSAPDAQFQYFAIYVQTRTRPTLAGFRELAPAIKQVLPYSVSFRERRWRIEEAETGPKQSYEDLRDYELRKKSFARRDIQRW